MFTFQILEEDVQSAKQMDKNYCVIACALRGVPGVLSVEVGASTTLVTTHEGIKRYVTPSVLRTALNTFDKSGQWALEPGIYHLNPPSKSLKLEKIREDAKTLRPDRRRNKAGVRYGATGRNTPRKINPRYIAHVRLTNPGVDS